MNDELKLKLCPLCGAKPDYTDPEYEELFFSANHTPALHCGCGVEMKEHPKSHKFGDVYQEDIDSAIARLFARWNSFCKTVETFGGFEHARGFNQGFDKGQLK